MFEYTYTRNEGTVLLLAIFRTRELLSRNLIWQRHDSDDLVHPDDYAVKLHTLDTRTMCSAGYRTEYRTKIALLSRHKGYNYPSLVSLYNPRVNFDYITIYARPHIFMKSFCDNNDGNLCHKFPSGTFPVDDIDNCAICRKDNSV
jgi:hypothetical protein